MTQLTTGVNLRRRLVVRGIVQGVGFRPHVARLAADLDLTGTCRNDATCVVIEVEGSSARVEDFTRRLESDAPPMAVIVSIDTADFAATGGRGFVITGSTSSAGARTMVPPDTATCEDCLAELHDPSDRRFRHPFITCTNCGPRFTITRDLPYDRPVTTMSDFPMCVPCAREYADPNDRRHHAQPIACHDCGPTLTATRPDSTVVATGSETALSVAIEALRGGGIVAIKGLGGYHLACDASNDEAVRRLRARKRRPDQPFAVMAADLHVADSLVELSTESAAVLASPARPIVLLPARATAVVAGTVAPHLDEIGVMLPYTPLHHLLYAPRPDGEPGAPQTLVMTSGNLSGEPLCFTDEDALARLGSIADLFLGHDREIEVPCEDSVCAWDGEGAVPVRRSRGHAPLPLALPEAQGSMVLAAGAEIKNTFALARDGQAFLSAHIGDLGSLDSRAAHQRATAQALRFHRAVPDLVVTDMHPGYASRAWGLGYAEDLGVPLHDVQHHHAHLASLAVEHRRLDEEILGVVFDGTGYGCDATVWGGEFLVLTEGGVLAERVGHLGCVRLPGGDAGVRNPVRQAALALLAAGVDLDGTLVDAALSDAERAALPKLLRTGAGWVATSSVGRLFDVVSSLLGIRHRTTYEAQAAVELEATARRWRDGHGDAVHALDLPVVAGLGPSFLDPDPLMRSLFDGLAAGASAGLLAWSFHEALAGATADLAHAEATRRGITTVGLSGGVFVNRLLLSSVRARLRARGLEVLTHAAVPPTDGGLALGQVAIGVRVLQQQMAHEREGE